MITQQHSEQVLQWLRATVALNHVALNISVIELSGRGNKRCWPPDVEVLKRFLIVVCFHPLQFIKFIKIICRWQAGVVHHGARWSYVIRCFWQQRFVALDHLFFFSRNVARCFTRSVCFHLPLLLPLIPRCRAQLFRVTVKVVWFLNLSLHLLNLHCAYLCSSLWRDDDFVTTLIASVATFLGLGLGSVVAFLIHK